MADVTLLAKARKARFDDLPNFSGHPSEDVEQFLRCVKNIVKVENDTENREILEIVRGKLTHTAGRWFDNNESTFTKWSEFETAFRNRYFSSTMMHKKFDQLKERKQQYDEPVMTYIDDIVNLCQDIDPKMSDPTIIQHLMSGINPEFRKELSRQESSMRTINDFIKQAKIEQDLHETFEKTRNLSLESTQPYAHYSHAPTHTLTTTVKQQKSYSHDARQNNRPLDTIPTQSSDYKRNSFYQSENRPTSYYNYETRNKTQRTQFDKQRTTPYTTPQRQFYNCKRSRLHHASEFSITGTHDGGVPSKSDKPSTFPFPVYIKTRINKQPTQAIVDTGSAITIIHSNFLKTINHNKFTHQPRVCQTANSTPLHIIGHIELEVEIQHIKTSVIAHVATNLITSILFGNDWINSNHVHLFGDQKRLTIPDQRGQSISIPYVEPISINYPALLVNQITLPPRSQTLVEITSQINNANNLIFEPYGNHVSKFIIMPHTLLNINNNTAKVLLINAQNRQQTLSRNTRIGTISRDTTFSIYATTQKSPKHSSIEETNSKHVSGKSNYLENRAVSYKKDNSKPTIHNTQCDQCNEYFLSGNDLQKHLRAQCYSEQIRKHIVESTTHIENPKNRSAIQDILWRNKILFDPTPSIINLPSQLAIRTGDHPPIYSKQYPAPHKDQIIKCQETEKLLERGQIEESTSPWSSPVVLVKKKDKTMRFCIDYRRLNAITIKDAFPLPRIDEIFDQLVDALYYTKFDFKSGYFQVPLSKEDRPKTAFSTRDNHYQFTVLPQGITNGPATFQRVINHILGPTRWKYALAYIDDVIIYSNSFEEHLNHLNEVCQILKDARFRLNPEKCEIARTQTDYLGHRVQNGEIRPSPLNINGLLNTRVPTTPDEACKFVKAAEYYRKFIPNFSQIAEPLRKFVPTTKTQQRKGQRTTITLTPEESKAFEELKRFLTTDLVLRLPNNKLPFKVQTDASDEGIGAVLLQIYPDGQRPVAYQSKKFTPAQRKWSPMEQECYAFICALDKWHNYLSGTNFIWETDHKALTQLNQKAQINKRCERWRLKILEYDFKVKYIPGSINSMPDYLSRSPVDDAEEDPDETTLLISKSTQTDDDFIGKYPVVIAAVQTRSAKLRNELQNDTTNTTKCTIDSLKSDSPREYVPKENRIIPISMEQFLQAQQNDEYAKNIISNLQKYKQYITKDGLLMRRSNPPVPYVPHGELRRTILHTYHDTAANGAHFGRDKTIHKIKTRYYWPSMYKDINNYVKTCILCAQYNPRRQKPPGALKPIEPPEGVWQLVSMDFHGPITPTTQRGNKYIISLTDVLSKFVVTKAVRDNTAQTAARFLKEDVITKFGTPQCILTDNGTHFTSSMMNELIKQIGATHLYSTPYHPQTNGQVERYNSTMDSKIATLSNSRKTDWDDQLPFVTCNYNTSIHSSTKQVPFEMMYGRKPVLPYDHQENNVTLSYDSQHSKKLSDYLSSLNEQAKNNIMENQHRYKQRYDANRSDPTYKIGDLVLVKTLNTRHKFDIRYEGPFRITHQLTSKTFIVRHIKKQTLIRQVTTDVLLPIFERTI